MAATNICKDIKQSTQTKTHVSFRARWRAWARTDYNWNKYSKYAWNSITQRWAENEGELTQNNGNAIVLHHKHKQVTTTKKHQGSKNNENNCEAHQHNTHYLICRHLFCRKKTPRGRAGGQAPGVRFHFFTIIHILKNHIGWTKWEIILYHIVLYYLILYYIIILYSIIFYYIIILLYYIIYYYIILIIINHDSSWIIIINQH